MAMYKLQPTSATSQRWIQQEFDQLHYDSHRERIRNVRPSIDSTPPRIYPHLEIKLKRLQLESDRLMRIENENRRLLKALVDTEQKPSSLRIWNEYEPKSLNINQRVHSTIAVLRQNEKIVNRLINVKPTHNKAKLDKDWEHREKLLCNISRYRHPWRKPHESLIRRQPEEDGSASHPTSLTDRDIHIAKPAPILLKQITGRKGINHRRAKSMDAAAAPSSDKLHIPVEEDDEKEDYVEVEAGVNVLQKPIDPLYPY